MLICIKVHSLKSCHFLLFTAEISTSFLFSGEKLACLCPQDSAFENNVPLIIRLCSSRNNSFSCARAITVVFSLTIKQVLSFHWHSMAANWFGPLIHNGGTTKQQIH